jgi:hypothetical protein
MAFLAVERTVDLVPGIGKRGRQLTVQVGIILDDEETQGKSSRWSAAVRCRYGIEARR